jgi:hypothetical protein
VVRQIDTHNLGKTIGRQRLKLVPVAGAALEKSMRDQVEYGLGIDGTQAAAVPSSVTVDMMDSSLP